MERISKPSIEISSGGRASPGPVTLIWSSTVSPTVASELLKTAVTLGESANAYCMHPIVIKIAVKIRGNILKRHWRVIPSEVEEPHGGTKRGATGSFDSAALRSG